jgi:hypothetical protein
MAKQVIVISPPGQRLTMRVAEGVMQSKPAEGDGYTHVEVEASADPGETGAPTRPRGEEPPPPWFVGMSLVGGLPEGVGPADLRGATRLIGPLSLRALSVRLDNLPEGGRELVILGGDHGG